MHSIWLAILYLLHHHPRKTTLSSPNSLYRDYSPGKTLGLAFSI
nr:MAG TPA: hypothetical protein [Caudoviricetes sp.]DAW32075.1 MAG TPA: hypothetical protein [Caudoviricetes sp.]